MAFICREALKDYLACTGELRQVIAAFVDNESAEEIRDHEKVLDAL